MPLRRSLVAALLLVVLPEACAETVQARVTRIGDGDSLSVCIDGYEARVRLLYIDAPEYRQPFGKEARRSLHEMCAGEMASLTSEGKDRYGRILALVRCRQMDVNVEQVRRGMAWVSDLDKPARAFYIAQQRAREATLGLWIDPSPIAPWQWRRAHRYQPKAGAWPGAEARECAR